MITALGQEVEIGRIEKGLKQFWSTENASAARASLMNFAIYSEQPNALEENNELLGEITRDHACRAILIAADPCENKAKAKAWITAHCEVGRGGRKTVCSEQIAFQLRGPTPDLVRNIVFAHLESDLPLVFWWQGELSENFDERLYSRIHRLIVDSSEWANPADQFQVLAEAQKAGGRFVLHDLSWTRSHAFRVAVANACDSVPAAEIESVIVRVGTGSRIAAKMFAAWMATQLGRTDEFVTIEEDTERAPELLSLDIRFSRGEVRVTRATGTRRFFQVIGPGFRRLVPAGRAGMSGLVSDQLMRAGENRLFAKVMPAFLKSLRD